MSTYFRQFNCVDGLHICIVEDDGRVAYAYLIRDQTVVGDVWLYNQSSTPDEPEWRGKTKPPFLNSSAYFEIRKMAQPLKAESDIAVHWSSESDEVWVATIVIDGQSYAKLVPMVKPGRNVCVTKDGPLAKKMLVS